MVFVVLQPDLLQLTKFRVLPPNNLSILLLVADTCLQRYAIFLLYRSFPPVHQHDARFCPAVAPPPFLAGPCEFGIISLN